MQTNTPNPVNTGVTNTNNASSMDQVASVEALQAAVAGSEFPAEFRLFLQQELVRRIRANPKYSMRAFAKFLNVESSRLSKMLRGQRPIRSHFIENFGSRIGLKAEIIENYKKVADRKYTPGAKDEAFFKVIPVEVQERLGHTRAIAILELTKLKDFQPNLNWISEKIKMPVAETELAIEVLKSTGLIQINSQGEWSTSTTGDGCPLVTNSQNSSHRSTMVVATSLVRIAKAREMIAQFQLDLGRFLQEAPEPDTICDVAIAISPLK